jgi:hypothetical protein
MPDSRPIEDPKANIDSYDTAEQIAENFRRWSEAMQVSHAMLMAGLRDQVGQDGDMREAYRQWQERHRRAKMRAYEKAAERYRRLQKGRDSNAAQEAGASDAT